MELWVNEMWLLFTAVIFTVVGSYLSKWRSVNHAEAVIDSLIDQEYLKTRGEGTSMEILTWREWCDDQDSGQTS
jgi:hypothetical protein